jgi:hypothetical protein
VLASWIVVVNSYDFVVIDTVKYGLSPEMSGIIVQAKVYFNKVEVYHDKSFLKTFVRSYRCSDLFQTHVFNE